MLLPQGGTPPATPPPGRPAPRPRPRARPRRTKTMLLRQGDTPPATQLRGRPARRYGPGAFAERWPMLAFCLVILFSNVAGSVFNIAYNYRLIHQLHLNEEQQQAFDRILLPAYNLVAYTYCVLVVLFQLAPLARGWKFLRAGLPPPVDLLAVCRRRLVNIPYQIVWLELAGWLPGMVFFPLGVCV